MSLILLTFLHLYLDLISISTFVYKISKSDERYSKWSQLPNWSSKHETLFDAFTNDFDQDKLRAGLVRQGSSCLHYVVHQTWFVLGSELSVAVRLLDCWTNNSPKYETFRFSISLFGAVWVMMVGLVILAILLYLYKGCIILSDTSSGQTNKKCRN